MQMPWAANSEQRAANSVKRKNIFPCGKGFILFACLICWYAVTENSIKLETHIVEDLFRQCFHANYEGLHRYAFTILKDNEEAKDIVQLAFSNLWQKRYQINMETGARAYLYTSVHNLCLNTVWKKTNARHYQAHLAALAKRYESSDVVVEKELAAKIAWALDQLPPRCREIFLASRFEEKKYAEIAADMNISVKTVEAQMGKALAQLRTHLSELFGS
jgi:RNA polymerase sigma-70 factor (ECF subfamily)